MHTEKERSEGRGSKRQGAGISREQVIEAIRKCAEASGRQPRYLDLVRVLAVEQERIVELFGSFANALRAAGLRPHGSGYPVTMEELFADWAGLVRELGRTPKIKEYKSRSHYSVRPLRLRFGAWENVAPGMLRFAEKLESQDKWQDVMAILRNEERPPARDARKRQLRPARGVKGERTQYGWPLLDATMLLAPTNEMGVLFLFATKARELGFVVLHLQSGFPDCEALRQTGEGRCERARIEFEWESLNFKAHGHDPKGCDVIVCWKHNWKDCPLEVVELRRIIG